MKTTRTLTVLLGLGVAASVACSACSSGNHPRPELRQAGAKQVILADASNTGSTSANGSNTITTVGTGTVTGAPDTLTIGIGVSTTAPHAAVALSRNNDIAARVQQVLSRDGVAAKDIQTTGLSLQQAYPPSDGYQAYDEVTATIHDITKAGSVIDDALAPAGDAGRLQMVNFSLSSTDPFMASARRSAVASAKAEAEQLASAAGVHVGALVSISVQQSPGYPQVFAAAPAGIGQGSGGTSVPLQAGTQQVTVDVTTVWAIAP